jgi:hypothetical protein
MIHVRLCCQLTSSDDAQCTQVIRVQPNSSYALSAWVEGNYVYLGDTGTGTSDTSTWTPSAATWQQLSTSFTTGAATTSVTIYLHGWHGQGTYHAHDVTMTGPGGSPPSSPTVPAGLTVTGVTSSSASLSWTEAGGSDPAPRHNAQASAPFTSLLSLAQANHVAWFTFWSFNRDQPCPAGAVEPWAPGTCSNISQNPYDFTKIVAQYAG